MKMVVDTNVISELSRRDPEPRVLAWFAAQPRGTVYTSAITLFEVGRGIATIKSEARRRQLVHWWHHAAEDVFAGRILVFDEAAAQTCAEISAHAELQGRPVPTLDAMIAAICRTNDARLATRNTADMGRCGVQVFNPWHA